MRVLIIGGGNIGMLMAAEISYNGHQVTVYTQKADKCDSNIEVLDSADNLLFKSPVITFTNELNETTLDSDVIFITYPPYMFEKIADQIKQYIDVIHTIGIIPGSGGAEFAFGDFIKKGVCLFGFQRVHSIARIKDYGKSVYMLGRKSEVQIAAIPSAKTNDICIINCELLNMKCVPLPNYLSVTLVPSNPILHTSRLYSMFKDYKHGIVYPGNILFYEEWDDDSSDTMLSCDNELQELCDVIPLDLTNIHSLMQHYESFDSVSMTNKIKNITAFRGLPSPMVKQESGWIPDFSSRYFKADFSYGLKIIKDIAGLFNVSTPCIEKIWNWYFNICNDNNLQAFKLNMSKNDFIQLYNES